MSSKSLIEEIEELPELAATASRDYGRGYAHAIRDVLELIERKRAEELVS